MKAAGLGDSSLEERVVQSHTTRAGGRREEGQVERVRVDRRTTEAVGHESHEDQEGQIPG